VVDPVRGWRVVGGVHVEVMMQWCVGG